MVGELTTVSSMSGMLFPALFGQLLFCREQLDASGEYLAAAYIDSALRVLEDNYSNPVVVASRFEQTLDLDYSKMDEFIEGAY